MVWWWWVERGDDGLPKKKKFRGPSVILPQAKKIQFTGSRYLIAAGHLSLVLVLRKVCAPRQTPISKPGLISSLFSRGVRAGFCLLPAFSVPAPTSSSHP